MGFATQAIACLLGAVGLIWITLNHYDLAPVWILGAGLTGSMLLVLSAVRLLSRHRYYTGRRVAIVVGGAGSPARKAARAHRDPAEE